MASYKYLFTNTASTTLAAPITAASTTLSVTGGTGALFPTIGAGQAFWATLLRISGSTVTQREIVLCVNRVTDTMTVLRGQDGTSAVTWNAGDTLAQLTTAGALNAFLQPADQQAQATNYGADVGSVNSIAVGLTPPLVARVIGMPIRFRAATTNTGNCVFTDDTGVPVALLLPAGGQVPAGTIVINNVYEVFWNGVFYQLNTTPNLSGFATTAQLNNRTPIVQTGSFVSAANQPVQVTFATPFPNACLSVIPVPEYAGPDVWNIVPGSRNRFGFQLYTGNAGQFTYTAYGT